MLVRNLPTPKIQENPSHWPRGLSLWSAVARLLRLLVRIPTGRWMSVCCKCVLPCRGLCDELITRPEEICVNVRDLDTYWMRVTRPAGGYRSKIEKENTGIAFPQKVHSSKTDVQCFCDKTGKCHCMKQRPVPAANLIFVQSYKLDTTGGDSPACFPFFFVLKFFLSFFIAFLVIDKLNAQIICCTISLLYSSTSFEHYVLIIRRPNCIIQHLVSSHL